MTDQTVLMISQILLLFGRIHRKERFCLVLLVCRSLTDLAFFFSYYFTLFKCYRIGGEVMLFFVVFVFSFLFHLLCVEAP